MPTGAINVCHASKLVGDFKRWGSKPEIIVEKKNQEFFPIILVYSITIIVKNCKEGNGLLAIK